MSENEGVRIDALPPTINPNALARIPVMHDGQTFYYTVDQIATIARLFDGSTSEFNFSSTALGAALRELGDALVTKAEADAVASQFQAVSSEIGDIVSALALRVRVDSAQAFDSGQQTQARENIGAAAASMFETGTWTPTLTGFSNVANSTPSLCRYTRVGNHVMCAGEVSVIPSATTNTVLILSKPIASTFTADTDCAGTCAAYNFSSNVAAGGIVGNTGANQIRMRFAAATTASHHMSFSFMYEVK